MTGTVIDSLVVTLGLDPSDFTKGQKAAAESLIKTRDSAGVVAKDMEAKGKQAAAFFSQVKNEALGLIGVLLGSQGLESFVRQTTTSLVGMGNAARNIGMPIGELAAFGMMVERHGGNAQTAAASFQKLTDAANNFAILGQGSQYASIMTMLKLNPGAKGIDVYSSLLKYASENNNPGGVQKTRLWGQMLGLDEGTMNTLFDQVAKGGIAQFQREMAESFRLGVPTQQMSDNMKQLMHDWEALKQAATNLGIVVVDKVQPGLSGVLTWSTEFILKNPDTVAAVAALTAALSLLGSGALAARLLGLVTLSERLGLATRFLTTPGLLYLLYKSVEPTTTAEDTDYEKDAWKRAAQEHPAPPEEHRYRFSDWWRDVRQAAPRWIGGGGGGDATLPGLPGPVNPPGRSDQHGTRQDTIDFFRKQGYSAEQAAAIATTIQFESGYNAAAFNSAGGGRGARGAIQWRGDRIDDYRRMFGHDPDQGSYQENLRFIQWELHNTEQGANQELLRSRTEGEGLDALNRSYTRPGHPYSGPRVTSFMAPTTGRVINQDTPPPAPGKRQDTPPPAPGGRQYTPLPAPGGRQYTPIPALAGMHQYTPIPAPGGGSSSNKNVTIGNVHVYTQSTDAHGISKEINDHLSRAITDSNRGLE